MPDGWAGGWRQLLAPSWEGYTIDRWAVTGAWGAVVEF